MSQASASGVWDVSRTIRIPALKHDADATLLARAMEAQDGVKRVTADIARQRLEILYDASMVDYQTVITLLEQQGFPPVKNWWSRLIGNWYQFTDSNARENANLPPPACCNKAPKKR